MSYYVVKPPPRAGVAWFVALSVTALFVAVALLAGWAAARPLHVLVDGEELFVDAGTTVNDLENADVLDGKAGDLLGIDGTVIVEGGGHRATVQRNGRSTVKFERLYDGDVILSSDGADERESVIVTDVPLPFETVYEGKGPLTEIKSLGSPGLRRVTRGAVSGIELTSTVLSQPSAMVIARPWPVGNKLVALTFDDGPFPDQTKRIVDELARQDVRATFFMQGIYIKRYPALAKMVVANGHQVGTHAYQHRALTRLTPAQVRRQLLMGRLTVRSATGRTTRWLRPPYGSMNGVTWREVRRSKMRVLMWDVDSRDWTKPGAKKIARNVLVNVRPGSVVLMHDGGGDRRQTAAALRIIIPRLRRQGYTFVTVDELVRARQIAARNAAVRKAAARKSAVKPAAPRRSS